MNFLVSRAKKIQFLLFLIHIIKKFGFAENKWKQFQAISMENLVRLSLTITSVDVTNFNFKSEREEEIWF